jgi:hypothetical protein
VSGSSGVHAPTVNVNQLGVAGALIQDGVLLASSGGTVNVATGTYTETVTINKNLTLQGSGGPILTQPVGTALTITGGAGHRQRFQHPKFHHRRLGHGREWARPLPQQLYRQHHRGQQ